MSVGLRLCALLPLLGCGKSGITTLLVTSDADEAEDTALLRDIDGLSFDGRWSPGSPLPDDARALLVRASLVDKVPKELECRYVVSQPELVPTSKVALGFQPETIQSLDGGILALPRADSWPFLTLIAAAATAHLGVEQLAHLEAVPSPGTIGVVFAGSDETATFWLTNQQIDGVFTEHGNTKSEASLAIGPRAEHVLCVRQGITVSGREIHEVPRHLRSLFQPAEETGVAFKPDLEWGRRGTNPGELAEPDAIIADSRGRVLVGDEYQRKILVFDAEGHYLQSFGGSGTEVGKFSGSVGGIAIGKDGEIFVLDSTATRVNVYDADYKPLRAWGKAGMGPGQLFSPTGIAVGPDGRIYIADDGRNDVQVFEPDGKFIRQIGHPGTGPGELLGLESLAVSAENEVYVADEENVRIQVFDAEGKYLREIGRGMFQADVEGLTFDDRGRLWALDEDGGRALAFTPDGKLLGYVGGGPGTRAGQMMSPDGMAFHPKTRMLYVADELNYRISAFKIDRMIEGPPPTAAIAKSAADHTLVLARSGLVKEELAHYGPMVKYLGETLSTTEETWAARLRVTPTVEDMVRLFRTREADIAIGSSLPVLRLIEQGVAEPLLAVGRKGETAYHSVIFVKASSDITNIKQLTGKTIAFEDSASTSAFLLPATLFTANRLVLAELDKPEDTAPPDKVGYVWAKTERTIAAWVYGDKVTAGALSQIELGELGDLGTKEFRVIARSEEIAYYLVAVRKDLAPEVKRKLREGLLAVDRAPNAGEILKPPKLTRFRTLDDPQLAKPFSSARAAYGNVEERLWK